MPGSKQPDSHHISITELIAECEDYVRTEQFTRDLSSQILKMYLKERSNHESTNPFEIDSETDSGKLLENESHSKTDLLRFPDPPVVEDDDSMYENEEESDAQTSKVKINKSWSFN